MQVTGAAGVLWVQHEMTVRDLGVSREGGNAFADTGEGMEEAVLRGV